MSLKVIEDEAVPSDEGVKLQAINAFQSRSLHEFTTLAGSLDACSSTARQFDPDSIFYLD